MKELIPLTFPCSPDQHPVEHRTWSRSLGSNVFSKWFAFIFFSSVHNYVTNAAIVHKTITNGTNSLRICSISTEIQKNNKKNPLNILICKPGENWYNNLWTNLLIWASRWLHCGSVLTEVRNTACTLSELSPLDPSVCTLMWTGTLRSIFSRIHCTDRNKTYFVCPALIHTLIYLFIMTGWILYSCGYLGARWAHDRFVKVPINIHLRDNET